MYFNVLFQPLLSLSAHAVQASCRPGLTTASARSAAADILRLLSARLEEGRIRCPERVDEAWFPVCAWMDEALSPLWQAVGKNLPLQKMHFKTDRAGVLFFDRLESLLAFGSADDPEQRDILHLYLACLDLGFTGADRSRNDACVLQDYRRRCQEALFPARSSFSSFPAPCQANGTESGAGIGQAILWAAPVLFSLALYGIYRFLLSEWYWQIMG